MTRKKIVKSILVVLLAALVAIAGWNFASYLDHRGKYKLVVQVLPGDSQLEVDGRKAHPGTLYLPPGAHKLRAYRQYFGAVEETITVSHSLSQPIYLLPIPNTPEAINYLNHHPVIQQQREEQGALNAASTHAKLTKKYPIITKLPEYNSHFRIDYTVNKDDTISFSITLYAIINGPREYDQYQQQLQQYKAESLKFLSDNGVNPSNFTIIFTPSV